MKYLLWEGSGSYECAYETPFETWEEVVKAIEERVSHDQEARRLFNLWKKGNSVNKIYIEGRIDIWVTSGYLCGDGHEAH